DLFVGQEMNLCAAFLRGSGFFELGLGATLGVRLLPHMPFAPDFKIELMAEGVDHGHAYAVQSAGDLVGRCVEFAAGVELGQNDLSGCDFLSVNDHVVHWDAASVVDHRDRVIDVDGNVDLSSKAGQGFVDGVVHNLIDQMVQAHLAAGADVHGWAQAHSFHALQHFDVLGGVVSVTGPAGLFVLDLFSRFGSCYRFFRGH